MEGYGIKPEQIGRLEVGTETLVDKSKSVKTTLLAHLFGGCADIEGVTSTNACYGGTAALLNSIAWVESSAWDGRYAVVVCGDIAVYAPGPARPTGGGGAVAMLIGPDAPLAASGPRCSHAFEVYDFYKPSGDTEYATVDGKLSQTAYLTAVDECYSGLKKKVGGTGCSLDSFAFACLHSPYTKLVQKGFGRMYAADMADGLHASEWESKPEAKQLLAATPAQTREDRGHEKTLRTLSETRYAKMCSPCHTITKSVGNCYTGAVYMNLLSLVSNQADGLTGCKVLMFSYGSGAVATAFVLEGRAPTGHNGLAKGGEPFTLERIARVADVRARLASRVERTVGEFNAAMDLRAERYGTKGYQPSGSTEALFPGTYYLDAVDALHRRSYARTPKP